MHTRRDLLATLGAAGAAALAGCSAADGLVASETATGGEGATDAAGDGGGAGGEAVTVPTTDERLPLPMAAGEVSEASMDGGPGKDGIPSIDDPTFVAPGAVDFLSAGDPVFGVVREDTAKAYPQKILAQHEIVNDELAGDPVSVTYCPLTGTVLGFERGGTTFGVSGELVNNNLIMYDRATDAWWPQVLATSVPGPWNGDPGVRSLREFRLVWTTWERWREHHPETEVLSTETGLPRNYERDPYGGYNPRQGYYSREAPPLFTPLSDDGRYDPKRVVMGARTPAGAVAFLKDGLRDAGLLTGTLAGEPLLAAYDPRLDTGYVYRNPEGLSFEYGSGAVRGPEGTHDPDALPLERIHTFDAMWFAWVGFYPDTNVYE